MKFFHASLHVLHLFFFLYIIKMQGDQSLPRQKTKCLLVRGKRGAPPWLKNRGMKKAVSSYR